MHLFLFFQVDITCTCEGYLWQLYSDSHLSWADGCSSGWNSSKEYFWMVNNFNEIGSGKNDQYISFLVKIVMFYGRGRLSN